jgi:hypothetical protein
MMAAGVVLVLVGLVALVVLAAVVPFGGPGVFLVAVLALAALAAGGDRR